jgi:8-oxo-dGTP diphosphatase
VSQPTPEQPPIAAAIIVRDGKVLLVRRRVTEGTLSWQFPAGAIEEGETPGQAAIRETREETGLTVTESKILGERIHPNTGRTMIYVACNILTGNPTVVDDDELIELAWASRDELANYVPYGFYPAVQEHLDTVLT